MLEPKHILLLVAIIITITVVTLCIYLWRLTSSSHKQDPSDKAVQSVFQDVLHDLRTLIDETKAIQVDLKEIANDIEQLQAELKRLSDTQENWLATTNPASNHEN